MVGQVTVDDSLNAKVLGKQIAYASGIYHIPVGTQPQSPAGEDTSSIRDDNSVWTKDESDQVFPRAQRPGGRATARRARLRSPYPGAEPRFNLRSRSHRPFAVWQPDRRWLSIADLRFRTMGFPDGRIQSPGTNEHGPP